MSNRSIESVSKALAELVGLRLVATNSICGLRCFHFGEWEFCAEGKRATYGLQIQCAWRFQAESRVLVGSGDFLSRAEGNVDPEWEVGKPHGHLLEQKLKYLFPLHDSEYDLDCSGPKVLLVKAISVDGLGGFTVSLSSDIALVVFPTSSRDEEWALICPKEKKHFAFGQEE